MSRPTCYPLIAALSLSLTAAACGSHAPASKALGNRSGRTEGTGAAPSVAQKPVEIGDFDHEFVATGFPAIGADGSVIALAVMGEDGARGEPNLAVVVKDRSDRQTNRLVIQSVDDDSESPNPDAVTIGLDAANAFLETSHGQYDWRPLAELPLESDPDAGYGSTMVAKNSNAELVWNAGHVRVTVDGAVVVDRDTTGWTAPTRTIDPTFECSNPSFLGAAWIDVARKIIVARISFTGNDTCWEPDSEAHVIAW